MVVLVFVLVSTRSLQAQVQDVTRTPWMDTALSSDQRADMVVGQMTLDEKIQLVHGTGWGDSNVSDARSNGGAGFVPGIPRLHRTSI